VRRRRRLSDWFQLADSPTPGSGHVSGNRLDNTQTMAVTYAIPDVETPDCDPEFAALSDVLDCVVGDLEAYSQAALTDEPEYAFDETFQERTDKRAVALAAVFLLVEAILVIETVFVVFFEQFKPGDLVGSLISAVLGIALFANFVAGIAAAWAAEADQRWQASFDTPNWLGPVNW